MYEKSRIKTNGVNNQLEENVNDTEKNKLKPNTDGAEKDKTSAKDKTKILDNINIYNSKGITINLETEIAYCRKCSIIVPFVITDIENHIAKHSSVQNNDSEQKYPSHINHSLNRVDINKKTTEPNNSVHDSNDQCPPSKGKDEKTSNGTIGSRDPENTVLDNNGESTEQESYEDFASEHSITYNRGNAAAFCRICKVQLPSSLTSMKEHVSGASHKKKSQAVKLETNLPNLSKKPTREFIDSKYTVEGPFYTLIIINEEYCIPQLNYLLVTKTHSMKWRCLLCEITYHSVMDINIHIKSDNHLEKFVAVPVITSKSDEFIREVSVEINLSYLRW